MQVSQTLRAGLVLGILLAALAGCGPQGTVRPGTEPGRETERLRAEQLLAEGQPLQAAELYLALAQRNSGPPRLQYQFLAADALLAGHDLDRLDDLLQQLSRQPLDPAQTLWLRLLKAEVLLARHQPAAAMEQLYDRPAEGLPLALRIRYRTDLAEAYRLSGNALESARERQALDVLLLDPQARLDNQRAIVRTLLLLSEQALHQLQPSPPGIFGGWMSLALVIKQFAHDPEILRQQLDAWRAAHPTHPAMQELIDGYFEQIESQYLRAAHVAVLLPESGPYSRVAAAIRDGIVATWYQQDPAKRPLLRFYDVSDAAQAWPTYNEAVASGAEAIIGPLDKDSVKQLVRAGELTVPVLALNQVATSNRPPESLYQFSLSPEDEAHQAADRIWSDGLRRPVVLAPAGDWGRRIAEAFQARWIALGGEIAGEAAYDASATDYADTLRRLFHLDRSQARNRELERILGQRLQFEPRRRGDTDAIFMIAKSRQAHLLRPQLQFHHAGDLPVYTTSHAWDSHYDPARDRDLRGIFLPDMPWLLAGDGDDPLSRTALGQAFPACLGPYGRFYALGIDSYRLLPHLRRLQNTPGEILDGKTGTLGMDPYQHVTRRLIWARFTADGITLLGYTPQVLDAPVQGMEMALPAASVDLPAPVTERAAEPPPAPVPAAP